MTAAQHQQLIAAINELARQQRIANKIAIQTALGTDEYYKANSTQALWELASEADNGTV